MSDNIPFEIQMEIMKRLPVKSLIQFRSVCKPWKCLIDSSAFINHYSAQRTQLKHLLITHYHRFEPKHVSIADDDTFPHQKVSFILPVYANMFTRPRIIGSSDGLFCLFDICRDACGYPTPDRGMAVLWNISIRRSIAVVVPNMAYGPYETVVGFGVCRETTDPKIVKITNNDSCISWKAEVFSLNAGVWRNLYSNLPRRSVNFGYSQVAVDGFLYWFATERIYVRNEFRSNGEFASYNVIISFDMTSEEFIEVTLPYSLATCYRYSLSLSKLKESLVVFERCVDANNPVFVVWMMEDGVSKSFTKLYTVNVNTPGASLRGFGHSGEPMIAIPEDGDHGQLVVYEPHLKHMDNLGINGLVSGFYVYPYMETLLLLDQPNLKVYDEMETQKFQDDLVCKMQQLDV